MSQVSTIVQGIMVTGTTRESKVEMRFTEKDRPGIYTRGRCSICVPEASRSAIVEHKRIFEESEQLNSKNVNRNRIFYWKMRRQNEEKKRRRNWRNWRS